MDQTDFSILLLSTAGLLVVGLIGAVVVMTADRPAPKQAQVAKRRDELPYPLAEIVRDRDPSTAMREWWVKYRADQVHVGRTRDGWFSAASRSAMIALGPPGSGKTMKVLVPQMLLHSGPAVAVTTKDADLFRPTAQSRARLGRLWHYNPGESPTLPGCVDLRWSPLTGAQVWKTARRAAEFLVNDTLDIKKDNESSGGTFFRRQASALLAMLFHAAAIRGETLDWVDRALGADPEDLRTGRTEDVWADVKHALAEAGSDHALRSYERFISMAAKTRGDVRSTASNVVDAFMEEDAFATTLAGNEGFFDPAAFARSNDTIYITASLEEQETLAPLFTYLLTEIRRAQQTYHAELERQGVQNTNEMHWFLDELASMAPLRKFTQLVAQSGSTGLRITACVQDLSQAESIWGVVGKNLLGIMSAVVFPGITNVETTRLIAESQGKVWTTKATYSEGSGTAWSTGTTTTTSSKDSSTGQTESTTYSQNQSTTYNHFHIEVTTPGDITNGYAGHDRGGYGHEGMLFFYRGGIIPVLPMPYWQKPFVHALIGDAIAARGNIRTRELPTPRMDVSLQSIPNELRERFNGH